MGDLTSTKTDPFTHFQQRLSAVGGEAHQVASLEEVTAFIAAESQPFEERLEHALEDDNMHHALLMHLRGDVDAGKRHVRVLHLAQLIAERL